MALQESADRITRSALAADPSLPLVLLAHSGPTGLGREAHDPCGRDWKDPSCDWGDHDLALAINQIRRRRSLPLVVFGHMHHTLRRQKGQRRSLHRDQHGTVHLNSACVPRHGFDQQGRALRHLSWVSFQGQHLSHVSHRWYGPAGATALRRNPLERPVPGGGGAAGSPGIGGSMLIYVCNSAHGFGHGSRTAAVLAELAALRPDWRLVISTMLPASFLALAYGPVPFERRECRWDVGVIQADALGVDPDATLRALEALEADLPALIDREAEWIEAQDEPVLVLGDVPPAAALLAARVKAPLVWLASFGWDAIYTPMGGPFLAWAERVADLYRRGDLLIHCPLSLPMDWGTPHAAGGCDQFPAPPRSGRSLRATRPAGAAGTAGADQLRGPGHGPGPFPPGPMA